MAARTHHGTLDSHEPARSHVEGAGTTTYLRILEEVANSGITRSELSKAVGAAERTVQTWVFSF